MNKLTWVKKILSTLLIVSLFLNFIFPIGNALDTNGLSSPWTLEKAEHLAGRALIAATPEMITKLYNAGSAKNAVDILFPSQNGPDRTQFEQNFENFKWPSFNVSDTNANRRAYAFQYYADPYEAKRKLFWLFEDIFPVDRDGAWATNINFPDIDNHFKILYEESLWNYKKMVKRVLFDTKNPENSFAMGKYLDVLNGPNKNQPNENYARELMQLFLMLEHKPWEDSETPWAVRNYTEEDVAALARILTWFRYWEDKKVYFDESYHNTGTWIVFLSWALKSGTSFPFYDTASGSIDNTKITQPIWGNNGLWDNILDYIFSKRESEIAYFLSWRLLKYYINDKPTQIEIETLANQLINNNFDLFPTVKWLLSSDMMYTDVAMNSIRYKNPIELMIGTLKILHSKDQNFVVDPLLNDAGFLTTVDWTPYNPRSIFGREGFDHNEAFMNAYFHNQWVTYATKIAFTTGTGYYNLENFIPQTYNTNTGIFDVKTSKTNTFSGNLSLGAFSLSLDLPTASWADVASETVQLQRSSLLLEDALLLEEINEVEQIVELSGSELPENTQLPLSEVSENTSSWEVTKSESEEIKQEINVQTQEQIVEIPKVVSEDVITEEKVEESSTETPEVVEEISTQKSQETESISQDTPLPSESVEVNEEIILPEVKEETNNEISLLKKSFSHLFPVAHASQIQENTLSFLSGTIVLPDFYIQTASWKINLEWSFDAEKWVLTMSSWSLVIGKQTYNFWTSVITLEKGYNFHSDISIAQMFEQLEKNLYIWRKIPETVKEKLANFLQVDQNGLSRTFLPNNTTYRNKYIRAVISVLFSQPEFLLLSWYDKQDTWLGNSWNTQIKDSSKKLIMIELYGWYDWINGVIPKNEYEYYSQIRWSLAYKKEDLIEMWDFYVNKAFESFQSFYQNGDLRVVNRVGTPNHSRWHDTAAIQVASQKAVQTIWTPWLIWELIKYDANPLNNIVLWTSRPAIYTNGNFINIWGNSILYRTNGSTTAQEKEYQLTVLKNILNTREYPWDTSNNFKNSITLDAVGNGWQSSVWYTLATRLNFTKSLIDNGLGITYYVPGWGWYDTHGDQLKSGTYNLWDRTRDLANDISTFFTQMKDAGKDVTIIVYSEFGRTLKANGTLGTDHGQWGWYFILSTNNELKKSFPEKMIGKISLENEYNDWLGVWVDYRSIYSKILKSLYNVDVEKYFGQKFSLDEDLNTDIPVPSLLRREYKDSWWGSVNTQLMFQVDDSNFRFKDGSYLKLKYGQDPEKMTQFSRWTMDNYTYNEKTNSFNISLNLAKGKRYYYELEIVDNQYDKYVVTWDFVVPEKYESNSNVNIIPLTSDSFFAKYNNTEVVGEKKIDKLVLFNNPVQEIISTGTTINEAGEEVEEKTITYSWGLKDMIFDEKITMTFGTGETFIDTLTHSWVWNGWFVTPKLINKNEFISDKSSYSGSILKNLHIENIVKVGADSLWVGMQLNQPVQIKLPIQDTNGEYKVIKSEDGITWQEVVSTQSWSNISFATNHFTYFAVYDTKKVVVIPPVKPEEPTQPENPGTGTGWDNSGWSNSGTGSTWGWSSSSWSSSSWGSNWWNTWSGSTGWGSSSGGSSSSSSSWWWGWGGWVTLAKDYCPGWDFSASYYDGKCWEKPKTSSQTGTLVTTVMKDKAYYQNLKKEILEERKILKQTSSEKIVSTQVWNFTITEISWYALSNKIKKISLWIIAHKKLSSEEKQKYVERMNSFLIARYNYEKQRNSSELQKKYKKEMILLKSVFNKIKKL